jgi:hypothetical protein
MTNIKDKLSTICGYAGAISAAIVGLSAKVTLPTWLVTAAVAVGSISVAIIGYLTGKAPDGATKTPDQVAQQTEPK